MTIRRPLRITLWVLLLVIAPLAIFVMVSAEQDRAIRALRDASNREIVVNRNRVRPWIERIDIRGGGPFKPNFETELLRFTCLKALYFYDDGAADDPDIQRLCRAARSLPRLKELSISCYDVSNAAITPLKGHPTLQRVCLGRRGIPPALIETLKTLPALQEVTSAFHYRSQEKAMFDAIEHALPNVRVQGNPTLPEVCQILGPVDNPISHR